MVKRGFLFLCLALAALPAAFSAETPSQVSEAESAVESSRAPVKLDGNVLFYIRGTSTYSAEKRAPSISRLIQSVAADVTISTDALQVVDSLDFAAVMAGDRLLVRVFDADAAIDHVDRRTQAMLFRHRIGDAIVNYRRIRTPRVMLQDGLIALGYTLVAFALIWIVRRLFRRIDLIVERRFKVHLESLEYESHHIIQAKPVQLATQGIVRGARFICVLVLSFVWLDLILPRFPWTRAVALELFPIILSPLEKIGGGFVVELPNLLFLLVLVLIINYLLKLIRLYFTGLDRGSIQLENFDQDWAMPTYKIVRILIISFAAVIAYPYVPGSGSEAFKGISLFLGVMFSLGSSSVIANIIAGYSLTYRRAFKLGDIIKIGQVRGSVVESGLMVTRVRTPKNEDVVVPNSTILNNEVMNYSSKARTGELILHSKVGVGYDAPWRQVEAMLLEAANRTPGLLKQPRPFVFVKELADFAVVYEINGYCDDASKMFRLYTTLHQNILDIFNEYDVQIMTPAYEGDPDKAKVVPKDKWFSAPAEKNNKEKSLS